jgi:hypothetical protein
MRPLSTSIAVVLACGGCLPRAATSSPAGHDDVVFVPLGGPGADEPSSVEAALRALARPPAIYLNVTGGRAPWSTSSVAG